MNRSTTPLLILLLAWIGIGTWLCNKWICNAAPAATVSQSSLVPAAAAKVAGWNVADGNKFSSISENYFDFNNSSVTHNSTTASLTSHVASIASYLKANPTRGLDITGYYQDSESYNGILPNLGSARATDVKKLFIAAGVDGKQLNTLGALLPDAKWANANTITRGIEFGFGEASGDARLEAIRGRLLGKPLTLYFNTGSNNLNLTSQQRQDFDDMNYYLENVNGSKLSIGGHTDSAGSKKTNVRLSRKRAEFVSNYLNTNGGIPTSRMEATGFGPDQPVASNDTKEGMAKNRRVEVILNN